MSNINKTPILPPFKRFCVTIGNLPSSYVDSMSYYECVMWLCKYLKDTVIPVVNQNAEAVNELINWFENLDVQEEIDNKLDEMVESGELQELLSSQYNALRQEVNSNINNFENETSNEIEEFESSVNSDINAFKGTVNSQLNTFDNRIESIASGSPAGVYATYNDLVTANPDHSKIYVVEDDGEWYFWNSTTNQWKNGGVYQASVIETDKTLTRDGVPADAKITGMKINAINELTSNKIIKNYYNSQYVYQGTVSSSKMYLTENSLKKDTVIDKVIADLSSATTVYIGIYKKSNIKSNNIILDKLYTFTGVVGENTFDLDYYVNSNDLYIGISSDLGCFKYDTRNAQTRFLQYDKDSLTFDSNLVMQVKLSVISSERKLYNEELKNEMISDTLVTSINKKYYNENFNVQGQTSSGSYWIINEKLKINSIIKQISLTSGTNNTINLLIFKKVNNTYEIVNRFSDYITEGNHTIDVDFYINDDNLYLGWLSNTIQYDLRQVVTSISNLTNDMTIDQTLPCSVKIDVIYNDLKANPLNSNVITVAKDGTGDYTTINDALNHAYTIESVDNPITIIIKPGTYKEVCNIKGTHNVSLIGINKQDCIIRDDSGLYTNAPLRVEGNSYIANLTLIATHNEETTPIVVNNIVQYNPSYALHIDDRHPDDDNEYKCTVENCILYSEQNPAVGIGLDKNQTVSLINCDLIVNKPQDLLNATSAVEGVFAFKKVGSLFYHALHGDTSGYTDNDGYQKLVVKNCRIETNDSTSVSAEPGGLMENVETTFIGNAVYSSINNKTVTSLPGATLTPISSLNNANDLNA